MMEMLRQGRQCGCVLSLSCLIKNRHGILVCWLLGRRRHFGRIPTKPTSPLKSPVEAETLQEEKEHWTGCAGMTWLT